MLLNKDALQINPLAKYAVAFFRTSRSIFIGPATSPNPIDQRMVDHAQQASHRRRDILAIFTEHARFLLEFGRVARS